MMRSTTGLLVAALLGAGSMSGINPGYVPLQPRIVASQTKRQASRIASVSNWWSYNKGPGWTNRQVQRMATNRRNKARHKAACKGR